MTTHTLKTSMMWHDGTGQECEADVTVHYTVDPGYAGDRIDPPQDASVEISKIVGEDIPARFYDDDDLKAKCMAAWLDDHIAAEEYRAEMRAENLRMDREGW